MLFSLLNVHLRQNGLTNTIDITHVFSELKEIKKTKKRHQWSGQLLKALLERPYAAFTGSGGVPTDMKVETDMYNVYNEYKQGIYIYKNTVASNLKD